MAGGVFRESFGVLFLPSSSLESFLLMRALGEKQDILSSTLSVVSLVFYEAQTACWRVKQTLHRSASSHHGLPSVNKITLIPPVSKE